MEAYPVAKTWISKITLTPIGAGKSKHFMTACNKERMEARVKAWEDGAWVREAATAYASKHTNVSKQKSQAL